MKSPVNNILVRAVSSTVALLVVLAALATNNGMLAQILAHDVAVAAVGESLPTIRVPGLAVATSSAGVPLQRSQVGARASGNYVVWNETSQPTRVFKSQAEQNGFDSSYDIYGADLSTSQPFVVANGLGNQSAPAIAGSVVVWQDNKHSCAGCEYDILAKDLASGKSYQIATGPIDQLYPAISGKTVSWIESTGSMDRLMIKGLEEKQATQIATLDHTTNYAIFQPVLTAEYVVWAEMWQEQPDTKSSPSRLRVYNLKTKQSRTIAQFDNQAADYAIDGQRVVWTDPSLHLADLSTGETTVLVNGETAVPSISGANVTFSMRSTLNAANYDIWWINLADRKSLPLRVDSATKFNAILAGDRLIWDNSGGSDNGHITYVSFAAASRDAAGRLATLQQRNRAEVAALKSAGAQQTTKDGANAVNATHPLLKGIHAANGGGWNGSNGKPCITDKVDCPAIDVLGAANNTAYFGSVLVLDTDMARSTGRDCCTWGDDVAHAMRTLSTTYSVRVTLRLFPTKIPNPAGSVTPDAVAQQMVATAWRNWLRHIEVNNEPNLEWPDRCESTTDPIPCKPAVTWSSGGQTRSYSWHDRRDSRLWDALNTFYTDAWFAIQFYKNNGYPNIGLYRLWSPPMAECYCNLSGNMGLPYARIETMINQYGSLAYHLYTAPNFEGNGYGSNNNTWRWFTSTMQTRINNGALPSEVTEFGWTEDQMSRCGYTQDTNWPAGTLTGTCTSNDGITHKFSDDVLRMYSTSERHNAQAMMVWLVRGWNTAADGIDGAGHKTTWFSTYQQSAP